MTLKGARVIEDCCRKCGCPLEWDECDQCYGEGCVDAYEQDPINNMMGELELCPSCCGSRGSYFCPACFDRACSEAAEPGSRSDGG